jgi:hypothetical protein
MIRGSVFQELGAVIDELEERELTVLDVVTEKRSLANSRYFSVEMTVGLNCLSGLAAAENVDIFQPEADDAVEPVRTTFTVEIPVKDDTPERDVVEAPDTAPSNVPDNPEAETDGPGRQTVSDPDDVPYYKNYELLAEVYEKYETFAEMTEALDVDVTPATVREHMVKHDIHPTTSDDVGGADNEGAEVEAGGDDITSATIEADGYGLPGSVTMDSLVSAVQESRTLYETQTALGLDRTTTRDILTDLELLDLVTSRLASAQTTDREEVVDRIHDASTT